MWLFSSRHLKVMGSVAELWAEGPVCAYHHLPGCSGSLGCLRAGDRKLAPTPGSPPIMGEDT